jgi:hypothetical protein
MALAAVAPEVTSMAKTIAGVVAKPVDAQRLIDELVHDCLCDRADISLMVRDGAGWWTREQSETAAGLKHAVDTSAAGARSLVSGIFEGLEAVSRVLPGGGILRLFGSLGVALANAGLATAAEVAKALVAVGIPQPEARYYGEAFERGSVLVTVQAKTDQIAQCARRLMMQHGALAPGERVAP